MSNRSNNGRATPKQENVDKLRAALAAADALEERTYRIRYRDGSERTFVGNGYSVVTNAVLFKKGEEDGVLMIPLDTIADVEAINYPAKTEEESDAEVR